MLTTYRQTSRVLRSRNRWTSAHSGVGERRGHYAPQLSRLTTVSHHPFLSLYLDIANPQLTVLLSSIV